VIPDEAAAPFLSAGVRVYVLVAIIKKELALEISLYTFLQFYRSALSRKPRFQAPFLTFDDSFETPNVT
jgi:hypothetical protein